MKQYCQIVHTEGFRSHIQTLDTTSIQYSYYYAPTLELQGSSLQKSHLKVLNLFWAERNVSEIRLATNGTKDNGTLDPT